MRLVAGQQERGRCIACGAIVGGGVEAEPRQLPRPAAQPGEERFPLGLHHRHGEQRPHAGAHRLYREGVDALADQDQAAGADRIAGAQDGAEVARIAQPLGDQPDAGSGAVEVVQHRRELVEHADHRLRVVLARQLGEDNITLVKLDCATPVLLRQFNRRSSRR